MKIWLVTIGEPVPLGEGRSDRLHRTGYFAGLLADRGHEVTWWTSTFDHFRKKHHFREDTTVAIRSNLTCRLLSGCGYRSNLSLTRIRDHRQIARKFASQAARMSPPDILVAAFPIIELSLESVRFGKREGVPVVLDMRDMWPDIFVDSIPGFFRPIARLALGPLFRQAYAACSRAAAITGITEAFVEWGLARGRRKRSAFDRAFPLGYTVVPPSPDAIAKAEAYWDGLGVTAEGRDFVVSFCGTVGRQLDLETVISAARSLEGKARKFRFVLCGTGDRLEHFRGVSADVKSVLLPGWVGAAEIYVLMRRASVGLDPLPDRYDFLATVNNKAIEYMSAGLPVISSPKQGVLHDLLRQWNCGISCHSGDAQGLAAVLLRLRGDASELAEMSRNAARLFEETFQAERVYGAMADHLGEICRDFGGRNRMMTSAAR
jgi:glycosyltransferase involved in cell wall biosynthesis